MTSVAYQETNFKALNTDVYAPTVAKSDKEVTSFTEMAERLDLLKGRIIRTQKQVELDTVEKRSSPIVRLDREVLNQVLLGYANNYQTQLDYQTAAEQMVSTLQDACLKYAEQLKLESMSGKGVEQLRVQAESEQKDLVRRHRVSRANLEAWKERLADTGRDLSRVMTYYKNRWNSVTMYTGEWQPQKAEITALVETLTGGASRKGDLEEEESSLVPTSTGSPAPTVVEEEIAEEDDAASVEETSGERHREPRRVGIEQDGYTSE